MKTSFAIIAAGAALAFVGCATNQNSETVSLDTAAIRPVVPESKLSPAPTGVYDLSKVDSPPTPLKFATTDRLVRDYDRRLVPLGTGAAEVVYTVTEKGTVSDVTVFSATTPAHGEAASEIVKGWKFKPAQKDGHAVACRSSWGLTLNFKVNDSGAGYVRPDYRGLGPTHPNGY